MADTQGTEPNENEFGFGASLEKATPVHSEEWADLLLSGAMPPGAMTVAEMAQVERRARLKAFFDGESIDPKQNLAKPPEKPNMPEVTMGRYALDDSLNVISSVEGRPELREPRQPWKGGDVGALQIELAIAYRLLALLVDNRDGAVYLSPAEVAQVLGNSPMLLNLGMTWRIPPSGGPSLTLESGYNSSPPRDPFTWPRFS